MAVLPSFLKVGDRSYEIEYEQVLKRTSSVRIKKGKVVLKLSRYLRGAQLDEAVEKFLQWAGKQLEKFAATDFILPEYVDGGRIATHNKIYDLRVFVAKRDKARVFLREGSLIHLYLPNDLSEVEQAKKVKFLVEKVIMEDQIGYLKEVLDELNQLHFQAKYREVRFKRVNSRFGSCSSKGNINIAYRLLFAPKEVFQYVCVHELAHLKEFNHSKRFWALVEEAMPNYKLQEKWLKNNGFMLG